MDLHWDEHHTFVSLNFVQPNPTLAKPVFCAVSPPECLSSVQLNNMRDSIMRTKLTLAIGAALLAACGGDTSTPQEEKPFDYSQLQLTPQNTSPLVLVDNKKLGQHLKNGI